MTVSAKKALAWVVIAGCLGVQYYEVRRPHDGRFFPFLDYPMYARSFQPGATARMRQLRAVSCDIPARTWRIPPREIGHLSFTYRERLGAAAQDGPGGEAERAAISAIVSGHIAPRPCELQVWERTASTTADGVDPAVFERPQWVLRRAWRLEVP